MTFSVESVDDVFSVKINEMEINNVTDYKITTSAKGDTEVALEIRIPANVKFIVGSES